MFSKCVRRPRHLTNDDQISPTPVPGASLRVPVEIWTYIFKCGILARKDLRTPRLCCKYLNSIATRIFFQAGAVSQLRKKTLTAAFVAKSLVQLDNALCKHLTTFTIFGESRWGTLTVTVEELCLILDNAVSLKTVALACVFISGPPKKGYKSTYIVRNRHMRVSFVSVDFESASTFIQTMVTVGYVDWIHFEGVKLTRGIQQGLGCPSADELHCSTWRACCRRLSLYSTSWVTMGAFTSISTVDNAHAKSIEELDLSFLNTRSASKAFPLLQACSQLKTLRVHFYSTTRANPPCASIHCVDSFIGH